MFAKPFVAAFTHDDGVTCLARNLRHLNGLVRPRVPCQAARHGLAIGWWSPGGFADTGVLILAAQELMNAKQERTAN